MDDHWSDTEVVIIVVFVVLATVAVTRLLGKKKDAQHE
jgi:regulatory protein YycI of two-component signal transduction system YycFG